MFLKVRNEEERRHIFDKFMTLKTEIKNEAIERKLSKFDALQKNAEAYAPIIQAQNETTEQIINLRKRELPSTESKVINKKKNAVLFDVNYHENNGEFYFGQTKFEINPDSISVNHVTLPYTQGLIDLITLKNPNQFTEQDASDYKKFLTAINWGRNKAGNLRSIKINSTNKKVKLQREFIDHLKNNTQSPPKEEKGEYSQTGNSIIIPQDINSLLNKLHLLCSQYRAGNLATLPTIVAFLDYLQETNHMSRQEYQKINDLLYAQSK